MVTSSSRAPELPEVPLPLRAWARLGPVTHGGWRRRGAVALSQRLLIRGRHYRASGGFAWAIDPEDPFQVGMLLGVHDPLVEAVIDRFAKAGSTVIDAGAHLGYFTLRFARRVGATGSVHSFECDPRLFGRLGEHVRRNDLPWVQPNQIAVDERSDSGVVVHLPSQLGWASVVPGVWEPEGEATVDAVSIDDYARRETINPSDISFIKLDVEGAELPALRGMHETLETTRAAVLVEFIPERLIALGQDPEALLELMNQHGYLPYWPSFDPAGQLKLQPGAEAEEGEDLLFVKGAMSS